MNKLLLLAVALCFAFFSAKSQTNVSGNISANTTWTETGSPYILIGNVGVRADLTLTIEPGVTIERTSDFQILINGALKMNGTADDSIQIITDINPIPDPKIFPFAPDTKPFIEFQKSKLDSSSLSYVSFQQSNYKTNHVRLGDESAFSQTNPKNSGTLIITHSNVSNGYITTNGYQTQALLSMDSCMMDNGFVYAYDAYKEGISIMNSQIINSAVWCNRYANKITFTNCYLSNNKLYLMSPTEILNSTLENNKGESVGGDNITTIRNSNFVNTYFNYPYTGFDISDSKFTVNDKLTDPYGNTVQYLFNLSQINTKNVQFVNDSSYAISGINITGASSSFVQNDTIIYSQFQHFYDAVTVKDFVGIRLDSNNFSIPGRYDIDNQSTKDFSALYNYYELKDGQTIDDVIFDQNDDLSYGLVTYTPYLTSPAVLPVTLVNLVGDVEGKTIQLSWKTSEEVNLAKYVIERKSNNDFIVVGTVYATGSSGSSIHNYRFTDYTPTLGTNYYRLKAVDKDGNYNYSIVVPVSFSTSITKLYVYPNPANNYVTIERKAAASDAQVELVSISGRIIKTIMVAKGNSQTKLNVIGIAKGTYKVIWLEGTETENQTLLIQ